MAQVKYYRFSAGKVESQEVDAETFGRRSPRRVQREAVLMYRANARAGTHDTLRRSEVNGSIRKPWKQKHTGRARAGSNRSPLWRKGGIIHGPKNVERNFSIPRQKARLALAQALAAKNAAGAIVYVDDVKLAEAKTKNVAQLIKKLGCEGERTTLVLDQPNAQLTLAARNMPDVQVLLAGDLNAYTVLRSKKLVLTQPALEKLGARWN
jgi:large subunit ribosomal protein L4